MAQERVKVCIKNKNHIQSLLKGGEQSMGCREGSVSGGSNDRNGRTTAGYYLNYQSK